MSIWTLVVRLSRHGRRILLAFRVVGLLLISLFVSVAPRPCVAAQAAPASFALQPIVLQPIVLQPIQSKPTQAYSLPPDKLAKAVALGRIRNLLGFADSLWGLAVLWLLLATRAAARLENWTQRIARRRWLQGLLFFAVFLILLMAADLPLDFYAHSVSLRYGISVQGWGSWLIDLGKSLGLSILIGAPVLLLFNWIVRVSPRRFWVWAWLVSLPILALSVFAEPLLEPLFNQYEPLAMNHPALVAKLEKVVARTGTRIPPSRMFLMKASAKTNGLNAYVSGLGATKRIVVWDTTAGRIPDDEVQFIFGHESGHYVLNHIAKGLAATAVALLFLYWACAGIAAWLIRRFGLRWRLGGQEDGASQSTGSSGATGASLLATRAGFVVLIFTISVAGFVTEPASNAVSRHFEHEADVYGQEVIHGIVPDPRKTSVAAFNVLGEAWLEDPNPSPLLEFWTYNHPSIQTRATFALHYDPWANGGHGKFFAK
jgi:Zn-dependent protease with chaperone function